MYANNLLTIDLETSIKCPLGHKGSPFWKDNKMVLGSAKYSDEKPILFSDTYFDIPIKPDYVVGQNFKFDINYIRRDCPTLYKQLLILDWWDIQVAEYILTAQRKTYASLNEMAEKYKLPLKPDKIKAYWDKGIDTELIPREELEEYVKHDVCTTEEIAKRQMMLAEKRGQFDLIILMSNVSKVLADMEYNGLAIDVDLLNEIQKELEDKRNNLVDNLLEELIRAYPEIPTKVWNLNSNNQLSAIFFGGEISWKYTEVVGTKMVEVKTNKVPNGVYKTGAKKGQVKYVWEKELVEKPVKETISGLAYINLLHKKPKPEWKNNNGYSTSDSILKSMKDCDWAQDILQLRYLNKMIDTYCVGLKGLMYSDGYIHHSLNNTATVTGRLSSTKPNAQNIPSGKGDRIKEVFVSRFGDEGKIIQVDYSQLEIVWQAFVTGDENMKRDIINGVDFHCRRVALKYNISYEEAYDLCKVQQLPEWEEKRRNVKVFSFQRSYGAGVNTIAESTGLSKQEVNQLIENEIKLYPKVEAHFLDVKRQATYYTRNNIGYYKSLTGRIYHYPYYESDYSGQMEMSSTQLRNYDIQGGATGDLVPTYLLEAFCHLTEERDSGKLFFINTVHDSILLDCHDSIVHRVCDKLKKCLEDVSILKKHFGIVFDIPLKVDIEYGSNWKQVKKES